MDKIENVNVRGQGIFDNYEHLTSLELIKKILEKINEIVSETNTYTEIVIELRKWFDSLDVYDEVAQKIKDMEADGSLSKIINEQLFTDLHNDITDVKNKINGLYVDITNPPLGIPKAPTDGISDIGTSLQACIDYVNSKGGGIVYIPYLLKGYSLQTKVNLKSNVSILSNGSVITIPSIANTKFYAININGCTNVNIYGQLKFKSTNDKTRPVFTGLSSNVTALTIVDSNNIYIENVSGENIETIVNIYGSNKANEKNIRIDDIAYFDCNFPILIKQYSDVNVGYVHGTIQNLVLDSHDHVVYVNNNCSNITFDVVQGKNLNNDNSVWMVQCDTNDYTIDKLSNNVTFNTIIIEGSFSGFVSGGFNNLVVNNLIGNVSSPSGMFIGSYDKSKCIIKNVSLEGSIKTFLSCLGTITTKSELTILGGNVNALIGGTTGSSGFIVRGEAIKRLDIKNVKFNNIGYGGSTIYLVSNNENITFEECTFNYNVLLNGYPILVNSGSLEIRGCKFINTQTLYETVIKNEANTTVNVYDSSFKNFKNFLYYDIPIGASGRTFNCTSMDDNSISNEFNGYNIKTFYGTGEPEGNINAKIGSIFIRADGGTSTTYYVKESGNGNTGWIAK